MLICEAQLVWKAWDSENLLKIWNLLIWICCRPQLILAWQHTCKAHPKFLAVKPKRLLLSQMPCIALILDGLISHFARWLYLVHTRKKILNRPGMSTSHMSSWISLSWNQGKSGKVRENFVALYLYANICCSVRENQGNVAPKSQEKSGNFVTTCRSEPWWKHICSQKIWWCTGCLHTCVVVQ